MLSLQFSWVEEQWYVHAFLQAFYDVVMLTWFLTGGDVSFH